MIAVGYATFFKKDATVSPNQVLVSGPSLGSDSEQAQSGREILTLLLNLKSLTLDTSIFRERTFQTLVDFGQSIPDRPQGRDNPFLPIDEDNPQANP